MTTKLNSFDRPSVRALAESIEQALQAVGQQYGVDIKRGNGRFDASEFKLTINCTVAAGATERKNQAERDSFTRSSWQFGLEPSDFGRTFTSNGTQYTIVGVKPKSKRYPIICERSDGKRFKFASFTVKSNLSRVQA